MATVQYGAMVTGARGSVGGITFSKGGVASVVKSKGRPGIPRRENQTFNKALMARFAGQWRALSSSDRSDWAAYAATCTFINSLGQTYQLNGFQMFVRSAIAASAGGTITTPSVPTSSGKGVLPVLGFDVSGSDLRLATCVPALAGGDSLQGIALVAGSPTIGQPRGMVKSNWAYSGGALPVVIVTSYAAGLVSGQDYRAWVALRMFSASGQISDRFWYPVDFTA